MTERTHSVLVGGMRHIWIVSRLWRLSQDLAPFDYSVADFDGFDSDIWYGKINTPTVRSVLEHMQRIQAVDLSHPIILSETGVVMDGVHRICRAWLQGQPTLPAVQFPIDPVPDVIEPYPPRF